MVEGIPYLHFWMLEPFQGKIRKYNIVNIRTFWWAHIQVENEDVVHITSFRFMTRRHTSIVRWKYHQQMKHGGYVK